MFYLLSKLIFAGSGCDTFNKITILLSYGHYFSLYSHVYLRNIVIFSIGNADPVVNYKYGKMTSDLMQKFYSNTKFNTYDGLGHSSNPTVSETMYFFPLVLAPVIVSR